jgi:hypothetical protein
VGCVQACIQSSPQKPQHPGAHCTGVTDSVFANYFVVRVAIFKTNGLRVSLLTDVGVKLKVCHICFLHHFERVKLFCAHPVYSDSIAAFVALMVDLNVTCHISFASPISYMCPLVSFISQTYRNTYCVTAC